MKGIYLAAYTAVHNEYDIVYQDINGKRDIGGDMMDVELRNYDFIIATPPCNFWSHASGNRHSQYALDSAHLLPDILYKLEGLSIPYIVENVRNLKRFKEFGILPRDYSITYFIGRHTVFTNVFINPFIDYDYDFTNVNGSCVDVGLRKDRQGNLNVHRIVDRFLKTIHTENYVQIKGRNDI